MESPVSVARANVENPIATLQTLPLLLPAVDLDKFKGFFTEPVKQNSPFPPISHKEDFHHEVFFDQNLQYF